MTRKTCANCHYMLKGDEYRRHPETGEKWCKLCFEEWQDQAKKGKSLPKEV